MSERPPPLIIYHQDCLDGFGAAYAAWKRFGDAAEYLAAAYTDPPPPVDGREVTIVDFTWPRDTLLRLREKARSLIVLDHHKTAAEDLEGLDFAHLDLATSGAVLAWRHWHDTEPPELLRYVEDKDMWRWQLPGSEEVAAALASHPFDFRVWDRLTIDDLKRDGEAILRFQRRLVEDMARRSGRLRVAGFDVPCANAPVLQSYVGNELARGEPFALVWCELGDGSRRFSLRSAPPSGVDVADIARRFGGGGHPRAAGFTLERPGARASLESELEEALENRRTNP